MKTPEDNLISEVVETATKADADRRAGELSELEQLFRLVSGSAGDQLREASKYNSPEYDHVFTHPRSRSK